MLLSSWAKVRPIMMMRDWHQGCGNVWREECDQLINTVNENTHWLSDLQVHPTLVNGIKSFLQDNFFFNCFKSGSLVLDWSPKDPFYPQSPSFLHTLTSPVRGKEEHFLRKTDWHRCSVPVSAKGNNLEESFFIKWRRRSTQHKGAWTHTFSKVFIQSGEEFAQNLSNWAFLWIFNNN